MLQTNLEISNQIFLVFNNHNQKFKNKAAINL